MKKCTIYDGGARRYEIHEHIEEVLEFWNGMLERADEIDLKDCWMRNLVIRLLWHTMTGWKQTIIRS